MTPDSALLPDETLAAMTALPWSALPAGETLVQDGRLMLTVCPSCGNVQLYPVGACRRCDAAADVRAASGNGTVYSYTVVRRTGRPGFAQIAPYVLALIELPEGVRLIGNVLTDWNTVQIGMEVRLTVLTRGELFVVQWLPR